MRPKRTIGAIVVCSLIVLLISTSLHAYLDPNAAGKLSQILTPLLVAAVVALTFFRKHGGAALAGLSRTFSQRADV
jgi:xanthine/uracil permease